MLKTRVGAPDQHQALGVLLAQRQDQPPAAVDVVILVAPEETPPPPRSLNQYLDKTCERRQL